LRTHKFIDRHSEIKQLNNLYQSPGSQLAILYGRRRLGKTTLLREFCRDKIHCYYMADKAGEKSQKKSLTLALSTTLQEPLLQAALNFKLSSTHLSGLTPFPDPIP